MNKPRFGIMLGLAILWFVVILALFYSVQKPFTLANSRALLDSLLNLAAAALILLLASALGWELLKSLTLISPDQRLIFAAGVGLGIFSLATLGLGMAGLLYSEIFVAIGLLLFIILRRQVLTVIRTLPSLWSLPHPPPLFILYFAATLSISLLASLTPPISFDALLYHLSAPQIYLQEHRILIPAEPNIYFPFFFPSLGEMLFLLAMSIRGDVSAQVIHYLYGLLLAFSLLHFSRHYFTRRVGWWSLALVWSMPLVPLIISWAYVDFALAFYSFLAFWALVLWLDSQKRSHLLLAGAFAGFALGVKYTAFVLPLALLGLFLYHSLRHRQYSIAASMRNAFIFAGIALLSALPWYLRNLYFTGNPVFPFFLGGKSWDGWLSAWYTQAGAGLGIGPTRVLTLPLTVTLGIEDESFFDGRIGPLFLALLPILFLARFLTKIEEHEGSNQIAGYSVFVSLLHIGFWTVGVLVTHSLFQGRLLLPGLVFLSPPLALALVRLPATSLPRFSAQRFFAVALGLVLLLGFQTQTLEFLSHDPLPYLLGWESRAEYLKRNLAEHYQALQAIEQNLPQTAVVQFLWEPRTYYCPRTCRPDPILGFFKHEVYLYGTVEAVAQNLRAQGITHLLVYEWGRNFLEQNPRTAFTDQESEVWRELVATDLRPVYADQSGNYILYALH